MIKKVEKFLETYGLLEGEKTFVIGFSGGWDSMCLMDLLNKLSKKYPIKIIAAHYNHGWRGEESDKEEKVCEDFCKERDIIFYTKKAPQNAKKNETTARNLRYEFFSKCFEKYNADAIFTAHNKTDNAETVIYRAIKGTGINGLQGILPKREIIYRPLLDISRKDIENYCVKNKLKPNSDSSNMDEKYKRNFIRHTLFGFFKNINPHVENALVSLSRLAIEENKIVDEYMSILKKDLYEDGKIKTSEFLKFSNEVKKKFIYEILTAQNIDYNYEKINSLLNFIEDNAKSKSGSKYSLTTNLWLFASKKHIEVIHAEEKLCDEISITKEGTYTLGDYKFSIKKYKGTKPTEFPAENEYRALIELRDENLDYVLRTRRNGDYINPFGMSGKMKLKKYLISKNVANHKKDGIILFCKESEILWAIGLGLSDKIKVVNSPTHVLSLEKLDNVREND